MYDRHRRSQPDGRRNLLVIEQLLQNAERLIRKGPQPRLLGIHEVQPLPVVVLDECCIATEPAMDGGSVHADGLSRFRYRATRDQAADYGKLFGREFRICRSLWHVVALVPQDPAWRGPVSEEPLRVARPESGFSGRSPQSTARP